MRSVMALRLSRSCVTMKTVSPRLSCSSPISSSNWLAEIGSSPEVGSSRKSSSGSSARARASPARFFMPPESLRRKFLRRVGRQPHQRDFHRRDLVHQRLRHARCIRATAPGCFPRRSGMKTMRLPGTGCPSAFPAPACGSLPRSRWALPKTSMFAFPGFVEAYDGTQQHRLAGTGSAHHAQHFAAIDVQIQMIVNDLAAESVDQAPDADHDIFLVHIVFVFLSCHQIPSTENMTENAASNTITRNTDSTTERVVSWPTLAALRSTWKPS